MEVKINREIRDYSEAVYFGLNLRQFVFSVLACSHRLFSVSRNVSGKGIDRLSEKRNPDAERIEICFKKLL